MLKLETRGMEGKEVKCDLYFHWYMSPFLGQNCMAGRRLMQPGNNIFLALNFTMFKLSRFSPVFRREAPYVNH